MKKLDYFIAALMLAGLVSCVTPTNESITETDLHSNTIISLHLYDSSMLVSEKELVNVLENFNKVIATIGYPGAGYSIWKTQDDSMMQGRFMLIGRWPDQAAYDSIHNNESYNAFFEENKEFFESARKNSFYTKYDLMKN